MPGNKYDFQGGTSMAAQLLQVVAALIRSQFPKLTAPQVKHIIMQSGIAPKTKFILGGDESKAATMNQISVSGKMVNAYNALLMARAVNSGKVKI